MTSDPQGATGRAGVSRRQLLIGGAAVGVGAVAGSAATASAQQRPSSPAPIRYEFHGPHQAGIARTPGALVAQLAFDLRDTTDREGLGRLMRLWSDDARRLMAGEAPLADTEPELARLAAGLTVTFGWGRRAAVLAAGESRVPAWLDDLPPFSIDRLEERWSGGDLLVLVAADDALAVSHSVRMLTKDADHFATLRWRQDGFRHAPASLPAGSTMRNLFGQLDGTANPPPGSPAFERSVWIRDGWLAGGTSFVARRIRMDLDTWDEVDRPGRENAIGRTLDTGAPLTGSRERDEPDFAAVTDNGFPVISEVSHIRRARADDPADRIVRLAYNYDDPPQPGERSNAGQLFGSFQADVARQFIPIQQRLAQADLLNQWTTPIGSAVFVMPPGCAPGGFVGDGVLA